MLSEIEIKKLEQEEYIKLCESELDIQVKKGESFNLNEMLPVKLTSLNLYSESSIQTVIVVTFFWLSLKSIMFAASAGVQATKVKIAISDRNKPVNFFILFSPLNP